MANAKSRIGPSCIKRFRNLGENYTCYYTVFDEWKDIRMYTVYVVFVNQNTPVVGKNLILGPRLEGGGATSFQFSSRGNRKFLKQLRGPDTFSTHVSNFRSPYSLVVINDTSLSTNDSKTKYSNSMHQ